MPRRAPDTNDTDARNEGWWRAQLRGMLMARKEGCMIREAADQPPQMIGDESPDFIGRPYNLVDWRPTRVEREFFRLEGPKVTEETARKWEKDKGYS